MEVTVVTTKAERDEMRRTLDMYADYIAGDVSRDEFLAACPRKVWIDTEECSSHRALPDRLPFLVVDNREGECFEEDFETLDGAVLYATDVYLTPEHQEDWDRTGAVKDGGDLVGRVQG